MLDSGKSWKPACTVCGSRSPFAPYNLAVELERETLRLRFFIRSPTRMRPGGERDLWKGKTRGRQEAGTLWETEKRM